MNKYMTQFEVRAGDTFNRLTAVSLSYIKHKRHHWLFKCACGEMTVVRRDRVKRGVTRSCGCIRREMMRDLAKKQIIHGKTNTSVYIVHRNLMNRCYKKKDIGYPHYGGRGIYVVPEWHDFQQFYKDMGDPPKGMSIDRIDNNGPYCKSNCRWATIQQQNANKRNCRKLTYKNRTQNLIDWAKELKMDRSTIRYKLNKGISFEEIVTRKLEGKHYESRRNTSQRTEIKT